jgi:hypothetical protein
MPPARIAAPDTLQVLRCAAVSQLNVAIGSNCEMVGGPDQVRCTGVFTGNGRLDRNDG